MTTPTRRASSASSRSNVQFGLPTTNPLYTQLDAALEADEPREAGRDVQGHQRVHAKTLPGVPYVNTMPALAFKKTVIGFRPSPTLNDNFELVRFAG